MSVRLVCILDIVMYVNGMYSLTYVVLCTHDVRDHVWFDLKGFAWMGVTLSVDVCTVFDMREVVVCEVDVCV